MIFSRIKLIGLAVALIFIAFFVWDYSRLKSENERLNNELTAANATIEKLDQKVQAEADITRTRDQAIRRIRNAPESDDGPIAPVLRDAINGLQSNR